MKNYGLDITKIVITPDHYTLGGGQLVGKILREDGQWDEFLPEYELLVSYNGENGRNNEDDSNDQPRRVERMKHK